MREVFKRGKDLVNTNEIQEIAKTLAKYGLGICIPHMHEESTGKIIPLPSGIVSYEKKLEVSFEKDTILSTENMIPIAWRWNGTGIEVCAACCGTDG